MNALAIILIGLIAPLGIAWQFRVIREDGRHNYSLVDFIRYVFHAPLEAGSALPRRMLPSMIFSTVLLAGTLVWAIIVSFIDEKAQLTSDEVFSNLIKVGALLLVFNLKSYLGPLTVSFVCCVAIYNYLEYGEIGAIALLQPLIDWIFCYFPPWIKTVYWIILLVNASAGSLVDCLDS